MHSFDCSATITSSIRESICRLMRGKKTKGREVAPNFTPRRDDLQSLGDVSHVPSDCSAAHCSENQDSVVRLLQILLPLYDNEQQPFPASLHQEVQAKLTEKFSGLSTHVRSPAEGRWKDAENGTRDEMVIYEVMTTTLDEAWWQTYRQELSSRFHQDEIIIRVLPIGLL